MRGISSPRMCFWRQSTTRLRGRGMGSLLSIIEEDRFHGFKVSELRRLDRRRRKFVRSFFFRPFGAKSFSTCTRGLRRGLHSFAASRLGLGRAKHAFLLALSGRCGGGL